MGISRKVISGKVWRLIKFVSLVEGKYARYSRQDIIEILDISESSFYRYVKDLRKAEIPIERDKQTGGYKIRRDYYMQPPDLTISEAMALLISGNSFLNNSELPYFPEINMATAKIMACLPDKTKSLLSSLEDRIHFTLDSLVDYSQYSEVFNKLNEAIQEEVNVKINYYTFSRDEVTERVVSPYMMHFNEGALYLIAYCHWRNKIKIFRIDRIREIELTDDKFKYPEDFSLEEYLGRAWSMERGEKEIEVKIEFRGRAARWVKEHRWHSTQELEEIDDDKVLMTVVTESRNEVKEWVLGFGAEAEVIEPEGLRKEIMDEVERMWWMYVLDW
jgi:predicted DNA-binding transcriptional regulator YafY